MKNFIVGILILLFFLVAFGFKLDYKYVNSKSNTTNKPEIYKIDKGVHNDSNNNESDVNNKPEIYTINTTSKYSEIFILLHNDKYIHCIDYQPVIKPHGLSCNWNNLYNEIPNHLIKK